MKWAIAAATLVILANGVVLVSASRERAAPATMTTIDVCSAHLLGGGRSDDPPALRLILASESLSTPAGLDPAGLRALGFPETSVAFAGRTRDSTFRWPRARPAWVRLHQRSDSLARFEVAEVAPQRGELTPDSLSLIVRGLVSFREQLSAPAPVPPAGAGGHDHATMARGYTPGILYPAVTEVIPSLLHLDRRQIAELRAALTDSVACATKKRVVIANGAAGGIWVDRLH
jgi:hypothetical protein